MSDLIDSSLELSPKSEYNDKLFSLPISSTVTNTLPNIIETEQDECEYYSTVCSTIATGPGSPTHMNTDIDCELVHIENIKLAQTSELTGPVSYSISNSNSGITPTITANSRFIDNDNRIQVRNILLHLYVGPHKEDYENDLNFNQLNLNNINYDSPGPGPTSHHSHSQTQSSTLKLLREG